MFTQKSEKRLGYMAFIAVIFMWWTPHTFADDSRNSKITTPIILLKAKLESNADVEDLMSSIPLQQQLVQMAQQLNELQLDSFTNEHRLSLASILGRYEDVVSIANQEPFPLRVAHYKLHAQANQTISDSKDKPVSERVNSLLNNLMKTLNDEAFYRVSHTLSWSLPMGIDYMAYLFRHYQKEEHLSHNDAINLIHNYQMYKVYESVLPVSESIIRAEQSRRFVIENDVMVKTEDGATLSAIVVRKRGDNTKRPAAFQFTIYANEKWNTQTAIHAAAHGYVGVMGFTRGKYLSPDEIVPWEYDGKDATAIIDWIAKQSWSDGRVVMYGGSYLGFSQWAATKYMHPALKAIAPFVAANPAMGLPMENNIFITPNYQWAFHVTNNKTMDQSVYSDGRHWRNTFNELFESGRAFRDIDKIEGTPNPWFQKWLNHPEYDEYYQAMLPFGDDYKKINIPVLNITGYFDGASITALDFLRRHYEANPHADHTLLIGPYNHNSAQSTPRPYHSNYQLDEIALSHNADELTFQWFDHLLHGEPKPSLLKDRVNYQLMGSNTWQHANSFRGLNERAITFHLGSKKDDTGRYLLINGIDETNSYVKMTVDLADRKTKRNEANRQVIQNTLSDSNGLIFVTEPFEKPQQLVGTVTGYFSIEINKRDVDLGFKLYELMPDGKVFQLTRYIGRASYANDMTKRQLLTPGKKTQVPIVNSRFNGKLIDKGSRLALVLNVNKNPGAQVNLGTGKDVSDETIADVDGPLEIKWFGDSRINIPLQPWIE